MAELGKVSENLNCPLCLDVFDDAKLLDCGHSFCLKCLNEYDRCHQKQDHMFCPVCRHQTELGSRRVEGLSSNVAVNGLVDDFNNANNVLSILFETRPKCAQCLPAAEKRVRGADAICFCHDCNAFMCGACISAHSQLLRVYGNHKVVSVDDILSGKERIVVDTDTCTEHISEKREFYCEDCHVIICHKCTVVTHNMCDHVIRKRCDVEREIRRKVNDLVEKCDTKRKEFEKQIREIEHQRKGIHQTLGNVLRQIKDKHNMMLKELEETKTKLTEEVTKYQNLCDAKLDGLKDSAKKMAVRILSSSNLITNGIYRGLEGDGLTSHNYICSNLEEVLDDDVEGALKALRKVTDAIEQMNFVGNDVDIQIGEVGPKKWEVTKEIELHHESMNTLAVDTPCSVVVNYSDSHIAERFNLEGDRKPHRHIRPNAEDFTFLTDGSVVATDTENRLRVYNADGKRTGTVFKTPTTDGLVALDSDIHDNIFVSYWDLKIICIFKATGGKPVKTFSVMRTPQQVHTTRCGHVVVQSSGGVIVLNDVGEEVAVITKPTGVLHPAVDNRDTLYVAWITPGDGALSLLRYTLDGKQEETLLHDVKIKIPKEGWFCMKCPSPDTIVLCTAATMYVIRKRLSSLNELL